MKEKYYNKKYYQSISTNATRSATEIVPIILNYITPKSVIDVGCGIGAWLTIWKKYGVEDVMGIDGSYIDLSQLMIDKNSFLAANLEEELKLVKKYDLVTSLEVAEHIHPNKAEVYIKSLCQLGDIILFSAAIPGQGGVNHINEQYPSYWAALFKKMGFTSYDCIREIIWENNKIDVCYRQNILFFVRDKADFRSIKSNPTDSFPKNIVHPELFGEIVWISKSYKKILHNPFRIILYWIKKLINK